MNAEKIRVYKIKNIQKTNRNGNSFLSVLGSGKESVESGFPESSGNDGKIKVSPKRYMENMNVLFTDKNAADGGNVFFDSLTGMTQNDITLNEIAKNAKKAPFDFLRYLVLLMCAAVFVFTGYKIAGTLYSYVKAARNYDNIRSFFYDDEDAQDSQILKKTKVNKPIQDIFSLQTYTGEGIVEAEVSEGVKDVDKKRVKIEKLTGMNSDLYCWIKVSNTTIDYPVVQTNNNDYYLTHDFEKGYSNSGAIFCDFQNSRNILENRNTVIYGHNMLDNTMFQPLLDYGRRADYFANGIIELITEEETYYFEIFSAREEDPASGYIEVNFDSDEDYVEFLNDMKSRSIFQKDIALDENSHIITLSTCVNELWRDMRFAVQAVLIEIR